MKEAITLLDGSVGQELVKKFGKNQHRYGQQKLC